MLQRKRTSNRTFGVTCFPKILYQMLFGSRLGSIAGAQPKNVASDKLRYGDIRVLSAVNTIFG